MKILSLSNATLIASMVTTGDVAVEPCRSAIVPISTFVSNSPAPVTISGISKL